MATSTTTSNKYDLEEVENDIDHFICCRDKHVTLCGKYDPDPTLEFADQVECEECNTLNETHIRYVEGFGVPFCPVRPACIGPPPPRFCRNS